MKSTSETMKSWILEISFHLEIQLFDVTILYDWQNYLPNHSKCQVHQEVKDTSDQIQTWVQNYRHFFWSFRGNFWSKQEGICILYEHDSKYSIIEI